MSIDAAFRSVRGRDATPEESNYFNRIAKELNIRDNDAIWTVAFLLGYQVDLAKKMPEEIHECTKRALYEFNTTIREATESAKIEIRVTTAHVGESICRSVSESAQDQILHAAQTVAQSVARKSRLQWFGVAALCAMVVQATVFYWGFSIGNKQGYARAVDVQVAASWAASRLGRAAFKMDQNGDLRSLVECDRSGWKIERSRDGKHRLCVVYPASDGSHFGWYLPE